MSSTPTTISSEAAVGRRRKGGARWLLKLVIVLLLGGAAWAAASALEHEEAAPTEAGKIDSPLYTVKRGPLTISVDEAGTIRSSQAEVLKNEVEGKTTILWIIDEGKMVKKGDLLVELDGSTLQDNKIDEEIKVQNAQSTLVQAKENLEVQKKQAEADVSAAEVDLKLAKLDLQKYTEGEYNKSVLEAQGKIDLAEAELKRSEEKAGWSRKLYTEKYISKSELDGDELDLKQAEQSVTVAKSDLDLLKRFTHTRTLTQLQSDVDQKDFLLTKTKHKAASNIVEAEANLQAKQVGYDREVEKLDKIKEQITKTKLYAPVDGMVVYATSTSSSSRYSSNQQPLEEGTELRERQELIRLPTANERTADIKVHESSLKKVHHDLPVEVTTDALPGRIFHGTVEKIAMLPDTSSSWLNPNLKVYNTSIHVADATEDLRPGMSCRARIIVAHYDDALFVPVQAMLRVDGKPTVYLPGPNGTPTPREVKIGLDNTRMVHILEGLKEGDKVLLNPPLPPSRVQRFDKIEDVSTPPASSEPSGRSPRSDNGGGDGERSNRGEGDGGGRGGPGAGGGGGGGDGQRKFDPSKLTPEQREKFRERMKQRQQQQGGAPGGDSE
ncbi:MAG: efflux transporter periplasmic adaptor subunit [Phycisphaera sp.]|nr:efflux transporter periplasmic adaptor subunit [Phycisphaera sp.]